MKVILFCGGLGTRLREHSDTIPKPMVNIGQRPMLWHLMRYYAHFGHSEFILCLGYRGELVKRYFVEYAESLSNDVQPPDPDGTMHLYHSDGADWKVTFADTGSRANIGQRLQAVRHHLGDDETFLANYSDGLSDLPLDTYLEHFHAAGTVASLVCVRPSQSFHTITVGADALVRGVQSAAHSGIWINGGYFAFHQAIFDYLRDGEDLVAQPLARLIEAQQLSAYSHAGFWACMDTLKDKRAFDDMEQRGHTPWKVWADSTQSTASD